MNDQKDQIVQKLQGANNVLVTVHSSPSVDQLASAIALTLLLNKLNKHATAVYSGQTPGTIAFLRPDETLEKNTDSLRDFIVALDKAKADKLRYKVEDEVVKIFITPYKSSISEKDLIFSQGDFNVDVVVALGIHQQQDVDAAITSHGRILHDATVITVNNTPNGELGAINWVDQGASSLSEMVTSLVLDLGEEVMDSQIATALLTGIVAETSQFSNGNTTPHTMSVSAALLAAGANQQLVASQVEGSDDSKPARAAKNPPADNSSATSPDETLKINRYPEAGKKEPQSDDVAAAGDMPQLPDNPAVASLPEPATETESREMHALAEEEHALKDLIEQSDAEAAKPESPMLPEPVADSSAQSPAVLDSMNNGTALPPIQMPDAAQNELAPEPETAQPAVPGIPSVQDGETLADIEQSVHSTHIEQPVESQTEDVDPTRQALEEARRAVEQAHTTGPSEQTIEPLESLNAQEVNLDLGHDMPPQPAVTPQYDAATPAAPATPDAFAPLMAEAPAPLPQPMQSAAGFAPPAYTNAPAEPVSENSGMRVIQPLPHEQAMPPMGSPIIPGANPFMPANPLPPAGTMSPMGSLPPLPGPLPMAAAQPLPPNPAINEPAPLSMSPSDQPATYPMPPMGMTMPPAPASMPPQQYMPPSPLGPMGLPPQGPPPPPVPPPFMAGPGQPGMPM